MQLLLWSSVRFYELLDSFWFGWGNVLNEYDSWVHVPLDPESQEADAQGHVRHESLNAHGCHECLAHDVVPVVREIAEATIATTAEDVCVGEGED